MIGHQQVGGYKRKRTGQKLARSLLHPAHHRIEGELPSSGRGAGPDPGGGSGTEPLLAIGDEIGGIGSPGTGGAGGGIGAEDLLMADETGVGGKLIRGESPDIPGRPELEARPSSIRGGSADPSDLPSSIGRSELTAGVPPRGVTSEPAGALALVCWIGDPVEKPLELGTSGALLMGVEIVLAGPAFVIGGGASFIGVGVPLLANVGEALNLLRQPLRQHSPQPVRAIPAQTIPISVTTGFLPIGIPFPV